MTAHLVTRKHKLTMTSCYGPIGSTTPERLALCVADISCGRDCSERVSIRFPVCEQGRPLRHVRFFVFVRNSELRFNMAILALGPITAAGDRRNKHVK